MISNMQFLYEEKISVNGLRHHENYLSRYIICKLHS
jgi:hypothetical protein